MGVPGEAARLGLRGSRGDGPAQEELQYDAM